MDKELTRLKYLKELKEYTKKVEIKAQNELEKRLQLQDDIIISMADLVENRDIDTGVHIKRTALFAEAIAIKARKLGFYKDEITDDFIEYLKKAMPLHDIGKIIIPDEILKAPRKLTKDEYEIMKTHTTKGEEIIKNIFYNLESEEYLNYACMLTKNHHEWWNEKGYPYGIKRNDIPLIARIAAIADVFDALISVRCYKKALSIDEAIKIIENEKGTHFDPVLVEAFIKAKPEIKKIIETL